MRSDFIARKDINTNWDRETRNNLNNNFKELYTTKEIAENSVNKSDEAVRLAIKADDKADYAIVKTIQTQKQVDDMVLGSGDSTPEVVQAREGFDLLYQRLNAQDALSAELNQQIKDVKIRALNFTKYGNIKLPDDFPGELPFELYRDFDGVVKHDFDINDYKGTRKIYWSASGKNANDGLTANAPIATWSRLLEVINYVPENNVDVIIMDKFFNQDYFDIYDVITLSKSVAFSSNRAEGTVAGTLRTDFSWVADGEIWKTSRSVAQKVYDYRIKDRFGLPRELKKVEHKSDCRATKNTWFTDGVEVWVNADLAAGVSNNIAIGLQLGNRPRFNIGSHTLIFDNVHWFSEHAPTVTYNAIEVTGNANGSFIGHRTSYRYARFNGVATQGVGTVYHFDAQATDNAVDGFNYHGTGAEFIFEYNCFARNNGDSTQQSANATTAHDGMAILRVNSIGELCYGPLLADVGGCYSIAIDCRMYDSLLASGLATKAAFYFSDTGATTPGKYLMINCDGGGDDTFTIYAPTTNPVQVVNLGGNNIRNGSNVAFIE